MKDELAIIPIEQLRPSPRNPRTHFDDARQQELESSIRAKGILQPLLVRPLNGEEAFEIIAGHRRLAAALAVGLADLPARIFDIPDGEAFEAALVENLQRADMRPMEEARAFGEIVGHPANLAAVQKLAVRLGKSAGYIWDRVNLLKLIPDAQQLLERGLLRVEAAQLIARESADHQDQAIDPENEAAFQRDAAFNFSDATEAAARDPWRAVKARSLGELKAWIDRHCRFDATAAAVAAPLEFAPVAERIGEALSAPGRGRKYISISYAHQLHPDAKAEGERTYCVTSWRRADGTEDAPACSHAILGLVVSDEHRGEVFEVCTASKDCKIHWAAEIRERERQAKATQANPGKAAQEEAVARQREEERRAKAQEERDIWRRASSSILKATADAIRKAKAPVLLALMPSAYEQPRLNRLLGAIKSADGYLRHRALGLLLTNYIENEHRGPQEFPRFAAHLGLDLKALLQASTRAELDKALATGGTGKAAKKSAKKTGKKR